MSNPKSLLAALLLLIASGCAQTPGAPVVSNEEVTPSYTPGLAQYAASQGGLLVEFPNLPFQEPRSVAVPLILENMRTAYWGSVVPFWSEAPSEVSPALRVKVLLDAAPSASAIALCREGTGPLGSSEPRMRVLFAVCRGGKMVSNARGSLYPPPRPDDPALGELLRVMLLVTLPRDDPNRRGDGPRRWWLPR